MGGSFKYFIQRDLSDCGPACLKMIVDFYSSSFKYEYIRCRTQVSKDAVNLLDISEAAEAIGFRTQSIKLTFASLVNGASLPAILHWNQNHFVVLYR